MDVPGEAYLFNLSLLAITFAAVSVLVMLMRQTMGGRLSNFDVHPDHYLYRSRICHRRRRDLAATDSRLRPSLDDVLAGSEWVCSGFVRIRYGDYSAPAIHNYWRRVTAVLDVCIYRALDQRLAVGRKCCSSTAARRGLVQSGPHDFAGNDHVGVRSPRRLACR